MSLVKSYKWITTSLGLKRLTTSLVLIFIGVLQNTQGYEAYLPAIEAIAGVLGITSLGHAASAHTLKTFKTGSLASAVASLIGICTTVPELAPFLPILSYIGSLVGAAGVGEVVGKKDFIKNPEDTLLIADKAECILCEVTKAYEDSEPPCDDCPNTKEN